MHNRGNWCDYCQNLMRPIYFWLIVTVKCWQILFASVRWVEEVVVLVAYGVMVHKGPFWIKSKAPVHELVVVIWWWRQCERQQNGKQMIFIHLNEFYARQVRAISVQPSETQQNHKKKTKSQKNNLPVLWHEVNVSGPLWRSLKP